MNRWIRKGKKALRLLWSNPKEFWACLKLNLHPLFYSNSSAEICLNGIHFRIDFDLDPAMKNMYYGVYETEIIALLKKYLKAGDVVIDVGANVGYISAFALGLVGKRGEVHAFEPVPQYFERLLNIQRDNVDYSFFANNFAAGEKDSISTIAVTNIKNIGWNTMVPDFMQKETIKEEIEVSIKRLDDYLSSNKIDNVRLIKIDTEGYEFPVFKGFQQYLCNVKHLPIIIVEICPAAYPKLNLSVSDFSETISEYGYVPYSINLKQKVDITAFTVTTNVVLLPKSEL